MNFKCNELGGHGNGMPLLLFPSITPTSWETREEGVEWGRETRGQRGGTDYSRYDWGTEWDETP